jgi:hypothetical protein
MTMLTRLTPDLAVVDIELTIVGGVRLPARMTAARLPDGQVALISPVRIDDDLQREIESMGPVAYLVAPNSYHSLFLSRARERFPLARVVAPPALAARRKDVEIDHPLASGSAPWSEGLDAMEVAGAPKMGEFVFHHTPSGTLVTTDLVFNVADPKGAMTKVVMGMMGTRGRLAKSRIWRFLIKDRAAHQSSLDAILKADFDRLIMAHGEVVEGGARDALAHALGRA